MEGTNGSSPRSEAVAAVDANAAAAAADDDWRAQLLPAARQRIVDKILATLLRHLPNPVPEGNIAELRKIVVQFEEKTYDGATRQGDYLRKISLKMLSLESKSGQAPAGSTRVPNPDHDLTDVLQNLNLESEIEEDQKH